MNKDLYNIVETQVVLAPIAITADTTTNGEIIDTEGYESLVLDTFVGVVTTGDITPVLYESDDSGMSGETVIPADKLIGAYATLDTSATINSVGAVVGKQFVRPKYVSANTASLLVGSNVVLGHPHKASTR